MDFQTIIDMMLTGNTVTAPEVVFPLWIEYASVLVGVLTGALFACERKLDIVGTIVLGLVTGYGGGIARDLLLQNGGIYFMDHPFMILVSTGLCFVVFYFQGLFRSLDSMLFLLDALSVGFFVIAGVSKALAYGEGLFVAVILGVITAVGGGLLRDVCVGETPSIFKQGNFYAIAGLGGALAFVCLVMTPLDNMISAVVCLLVVLFLRYLSVYFDWRTAGAVDLTPLVTRPLKRLIVFFEQLFARGGLRVKPRYKQNPKKKA